LDSFTRNEISIREFFRQADELPDDQLIILSDLLNKRSINLKLTDRRPPSA
jgi:hypothetical protein